MSRVFIVAAKRTAIGSFLGGLSSVHPSEYGSEVVKNILEETNVPKEMIDEALNELYNLRNMVHNAQTENNLRGFAFASLIRRIDGELITDYSNENLRFILDQLSEWDLTKSIVYTKTDEVKKN